AGGSVRVTKVSMLLVAAAVTTTTLHAQEGTATGTFTVKGKAVKLAHAYAIAEPDPFDKAKEAVRVPVSDVPLTAEQRHDPFALQDLVRANKLHAVVAIIGASKQVLSTMLYDKGFEMSSGSVA